MSARRNIAFVPRARQDFNDILLYSARTWGREQVERYGSMLDAAFDRVRTFPASGRDCSAVLEGGRSIRCEHHLIYYTYDDHAVIVHERRHVSSGMFSSAPDEERSDW